MINIPYVLYQLFSQVILSQPLVIESHNQPTKTKYLNLSFVMVIFCIFFFFLMKKPFELMPGMLKNLYKNKDTYFAFVTSYCYL